MKKTTYLVVISIITIICVIFGSIVHVGGISFGWGFPWGFPWGAVKGDKAKVTSIEMDDGSVTADTVSLDDFTSLEMDLRIMDVTIEQGDTYGIRYECSNKKFVPSIAVNDNVLVVKQSRDRFGWNTVNAKCKMTLTIPEGRTLEEVKLDSDVGDVKLNDIAGKSLVLDVDTGDLDLSGCTFEQSDLTGDTGDITLSDSNMGDMVIDNDTGDIKLTGGGFESAEISGNTGDIHLVDCDFGSALGNVKLTSDTGDVKVEGCPDIGLYITDFSTDIGSVKINGTNYKKHYSEEAVLSSSSAGNGSFTITTDIGDVVVEQRKE